MSERSTSSSNGGGRDTVPFWWLGKELELWSGFVVVAAAAAVKESLVGTTTEVAIECLRRGVDDGFD